MPGRGLFYLASGTVMILMPVLWTIDPFGVLSRTLVVEQLLVVELAAAFVVTFCTAKGQGWGGPALGMACVALAVPLFRHFGGDGALILKTSLPLAVLSLALCALCLGAIFRTAGLGLLLFLIAALIVGYGAQYMGAPFDAAPVSLQRYLIYLTFGGDGLLGNTLEIIVSTVLIYILFGIAFDISGGNDYIDLLVRRLAGHSAGAPIKATILSSALTGMVSGSATSNVLTSGPMTIPAMRQYGVPASLAGGIEAVSSTVGQVTPPVMGTAAFMMASITGIPYGEIAVAAVAPALIVFWVMFLQSHRLGQKIEQSGCGARRPDDVPLWSALLHPDQVIHAIPMVVIIATVSISERLTVLAGLLGLFSSLLVALRLRGVSGTLAAIQEKAPVAIGSLAQLVIAGSGLGIIVAVLGVTGLDVSMTAAVVRVGAYNLLSGLAVAAIVSLVLGIGLPTSSAYIIVGTMLAPGLVHLGATPVSAHLFVLYFSIVSMVTPPVAFASMAASGIAGTSLMATSFHAMRFGWILYVLPFAFVLQPGLLLQSTEITNFIAISSAMLGLLAVGLLLDATTVRMRTAGLLALLLCLVALCGAGHLGGSTLAATVILAVMFLLLAYRRRRLEQ